MALTLEILETSIENNDALSPKDKQILLDYVEKHGCQIEILAEMFFADGIKILKS